MKQRNTLGVVGLLTTVIGIGLMFVLADVLAFGISVTVVGTVCLVGYLIWPAMEKQLVADLTPLVLEEIRPQIESEVDHAEEKQLAAKAQRIGQALRLMRQELQHIVGMATQAHERSGYLTSSFRFPAREWDRWREELALYSELDDTLRFVHTAYEKAHQTNLIIGPRLNEDLSALPTDDLAGLEDVTWKAIRAIDTELLQWDV
jgi:hypothetical protein